MLEVISCLWWGFMIFYGIISYFDKKKIQKNNWIKSEQKRQQWQAEKSKKQKEEQLKEIAYINKLKNCKELKEIDKLTGIEFEDYLQEYFTSNGYKVEKTKYSNDFGVDLILRGNNRIIAVQAKRYNNKINQSAIREVIAGMSIYNCIEAMVITNNYFTESAITLAKANKVILWDRNKLMEKLNK